MLNRNADRCSALLSRREVSQRLAVHPDTLIRWTKNGRLPSVKLSARCVRYRESEVEDFLIRYESATNAKPGPKSGNAVAR